jgi:hypothetical protein
MRSFAGAVLMALIAVVPREIVAEESANAEPPCLVRARSHLPGETMASFIKGGVVGRKRLVFRRGDVQLLIDFEVLDSTTRDFLKEQGHNRKFPEEVNLIARFAQALKNHDEVDADRMVRSKLEQERLDFRLADVFDRGAFLIREAPASSKRPAIGVRVATDLILRLDYSYDCGDQCGTGGRVFLTDACQQLAAVTDWVR